MSDFAINPAGNGSLNHIRAGSSLHHSSSPSPLSGIDRTSAAARSIPGRYAGESASAGQVSAGVDRVELSDHARLLDRMRQMPEVRQDRIDRVRNAIARGGYDTDDKVNQAIERLIEEEELLG